MDSDMKFKYYCSECKAWHYATLAELCDPNGLDFRVCREDGNNASGFKRFIGRVDMGGNDIYEGHFVEVEGDEPLASGSITTDYDWTFRGVVVMSSGQWIIRDKGKDFITLHDCIEADIDIDFKIIGNDYENNV